MEFRRAAKDDLEKLKPLHGNYKREIGEDAPAEEDFARLAAAMEREDILFYVCADEGRLIGCCSICRTFSTFDYQTGGVFEDFYILPEYRHQGIARKLVRYAYQQSGVRSLLVGCADCDISMYAALGFSVPLGNLRAYEEQAEKNK
ncbi:MAG: GNAT family N-acetyltransferase [Clostridia bacterium]|nr:GNAT family N-acetyltransferase [Clostridia bacterium]